MRVPAAAARAANARMRGAIRRVAPAVRQEHGPRDPSSAAGDRRWSESSGRRWPVRRQRSRLTSEGRLASPSDDALTTRIAHGSNDGDVVRHGTGKRQKSRRRFGKPFDSVEIAPRPASYTAARSTAWRSGPRLSARAAERGIAAARVEGAAHAARSSTGGADPAQVVAFRREVRPYRGGRAAAPVREPQSRGVASRQTCSAAPDTSESPMRWRGPRRLRRRE